MGPRYRVRFFFDWYSPYLWADNEVARRDFGYGCDPSKYPLSEATLRRGEELCNWYMTALNQDYPPDPGPWRQDECDRFNAAAREFYEAIRKELGPDFEILYEQQEVRVDPDLDAYLADPKGFRRTQS